MEMRLGVRQLTMYRLLVASGLTVVAYTVLFAQSYLLALAVNMQANFAVVTYAMALGSLVTLLPISVSGLGTREAAIVAYLGLHGVSPTVALGFSLLVFTTFYIAGGVLGAVAWWIKPISLRPWCSN